MEGSESPNVGASGGGDGGGGDQKTRLMEEVAQQMDAIEADFGEDFEIGRVITIVEVKRPDGQVGLRIRAGQYPWVAMGMLHFAMKTLEAQMGGGGEEE